MERAQYIQWTTWIFSIFALVHAWRLLSGWGAVVAEWDVPRWVSGVAVIVAGYLAYQGWKLKR